MLRKMYIQNLLQWFGFLLITLTGVLLRLGYVLRIKNQPFSDFLRYQQQAIEIFNHVSFYNSDIGLQGMGFPVALGFFYRLMNNTNLQTGYLFNLIFSCLSLVLFYFLSNRFFSKKSHVFVSFVLFALLPNYIAYNNVIATEIFATFFFILLIFLHQVSIKPWIKYLLMGIVIGILSLIKPYFVAYPVVLFVIEWLKTKELRMTFLSLIETAIVMCLVVAPWSYRNYLKYDSFIPISYNSGIVLHINNNDLNIYGRYMPIEKIPGGTSLKQKEENILDRHEDWKLDALEKEEAKKWILSHPFDFAKLGIIREGVIYFSGAPDIQDWSMKQFVQTKTKELKSKPIALANFKRDIYVFNMFSNIFVLLLSVFAFLFVLLNVKEILVSLFTKSKKLPYLILIPVFNIAFFLAINFTYEGQARYNFPTLFLFVICTVYSVSLLNQSFKKTLEQN